MSAAEISTRSGTNSSINRFRDVTSLPELVKRLADADSECWVGEPGAAVFDKNLANQVAAEAKERLAELGLADFR